MLTHTGGAELNQAFIDASWQEQGHDRETDRFDLGGWGLVLLCPGELPRLFQGQLTAPDNNAAELHAVLEAIRAAPSGPLTVHTDNQAVIASVNRGRGPHLLSDLTHEVHDLAQQRGVILTARYTPRTGRHMLTAHDLANEARRGEPSRAPLTFQTDLLLEHRPVAAEARISLRRRADNGQAERISTQLRTDPHSEVPPSVQVLLAALQLAQPGEALLVRRASRVAQALWHKPERALRPAVQAALQAAREQAERQGVQVRFLGSE